MSEPKPILKLSLVVLFVVSMVALGLEVLLTRVFAVILFTSHSFMAISLALLGTGAGAIIAYLGKPLVDDRLKQRMIAVMVLIGIIISIAIFVLLQIEFMPKEDTAPGYKGQKIKHLSYKKQLALIEKHPDVFKANRLYAVLPLAFLPFLLAGYLQAIIFRATPKKFGKLYGVDLIGATVGSLTLPMLLYPFGLVGTIAAVVFLTTLPVFYAFFADLKKWYVLIAACLPLALFAGLVASDDFKVKHTAGFNEKDLVREHWSPFARVAVIKYNARDTFVIDNSSRTYYATATETDQVRYKNHLYNIPFKLKAGGNALIIASGGGQEIVAADNAGMKVIDAVEIAGPIIRDIVDLRKDDKGNPYLLPNVNPYIADGRSVAMRSKRKYDVIEMLEVNCWTKAGQVAQAWSPYFVFTQEAFEEYFAILKDDGILAYTVFSGSMSPTAGNKGRRFRSVVAGMKLYGIKKPGKHIVSITRPFSYGHRTMIIAKKTPFTFEEIKRIRKLAGQATTLDEREIEALERMSKKIVPLTDLEKKTLIETRQGNPQKFRTAFRGLVPVADRLISELKAEGKIKDSSGDANTPISQQQSEIIDAALKKFFPFHSRERQILIPMAAKNKDQMIGLFPNLHPFVIKNKNAINTIVKRGEMDIQVLFPNLDKLAKTNDFELKEGEKLQRIKKFIRDMNRMCRDVKPIRGLGKTITINEYQNMPINDDRPYLTGSGLRSNSPPKERFIGDLYRTLLKVMGLLALVFVVFPFVIRRPGGKDSERVRIDFRLLLILVLTGFGFMFVEMAGIYKFQLYLHHPTMALIMVLSSMVLGAGLGSIHSGTIKEGEQENAITKYSAISVFVAAMLLIVVPIIAHRPMLMLPMPILMFFTFLIFCGMGYLLGHIVPLSIAAFAKGQSNLMAWAWAITVTGSVIATVMASILAREYGMFLIAILGMASYAGIVVVVVAGGKIKKRISQKAG